MKKQIILIIILGIFTFATNNAFSHLGAENEIEWEQRSKINWEDFLGETGIIPKDFVGRYSPVAFVETHINAFWDTQEVNSVICQFQVTKINATGVFEINNSWAYEDERTDYVLKHEQGHFDISEIAAQIFELDMRYKIFECQEENYSKGKASSIILDILKDTKINTNMQNDYDIETDGGGIESMQKKWDSKIKLELGSYSRKNIVLTSETIPKRTVGNSFDKIECNEGWEVVEKNSNKKLYCITPAVAEKLEDRNWGKIIWFPKY